MSNYTTKGFFSEENHKAWEGAGTLEYRDAGTGHIARINYVGSEVDGQPGFVDTTGKVARPPNPETYKYIGEIGPGKYQPTEATRRSLFQFRPSFG